MSRPPARLICLLALVALPAEAGGLKDLANKAKAAAGKVVEDKFVEEATEAARCAVDDKRCQDKAKQEGREVVLVDAKGEVVPGPAAAAADKPGEGVWRNYDFTPGRDVWRRVGFEDEPVGRFPAKLLEFVKGNMQIVELDGQQALEVANDSVFRLKLPRALPEDFTLEFSLRIAAANFATQVFFSPLTTAASRYDSHYLSLAQRSGIQFQAVEVSSLAGQWKMAEQMTPIKLQADGEYAILYVGTERAANVPNAKFARSDTIEFHVSGNSSYRSYIGDFTVAVGLDPLYESLVESGSFTTRGILFDVASAAIRPESTPTLVEIERVLTKHADLKLRIEGHTDSTGDDAHNQELSEARARAVATYLAGRGIDGGRLDAAGRGETEPVADNGTPEGRQQNRRVVLVRL